MKKKAILLIALAFATFANGPPVMAKTAAKSALCIEKFTAPAIETSGSDISMICMEMSYQADSPKSSPTLNGSSGNALLYADANVSGDKPDDAWAMYCEMADINYNFKAIANKTTSHRLRFNSAHTYNVCSVRMNARDYSMIGYNKRC